MKLLSIFETTFKEILRQKAFLILVVISIFIILSSLILFPISAGEEEKILKDFGISIIPIVNVLFIVVIGSVTFYQEFEKRTIYILKTAPTKGWEIAGGKFIAFLLIVIINVIMLFLVHQIILFFIIGKFAFELFISFIPFFFEIMILISIMILFSSFSNYFLSAFLTIGLYLSGHSLHVLKILAEKTSIAFFKYFLSGLYLILPNLEYFNIKTNIMYNKPLSSDYFLFSICYGIIYTLILLYLSHIILEKREFR